MESADRSKSWVADQGITHWVRHDPRSAKAMITGHGDGREEQYERFAESHRTNNPAASDEEIMDRFAAVSQERNRKLQRRSIVQAAKARESCKKGARLERYSGACALPSMEACRFKRRQAVSCGNLAAIVIETTLWLPARLRLGS